MGGGPRRRRAGGERGGRGSNVGSNVGNRGSNVGNLRLAPTATHPAPSRCRRRASCTGSLLEVERRGTPRGGVSGPASGSDRAGCGERSCLPPPRTLESAPPAIEQAGTPRSRRSRHAAGAAAARSPSGAISQSFSAGAPEPCECRPRPIDSPLCACPGSGMSWDTSVLIAVAPCWVESCGDRPPSTSGEPLAPTAADRRAVLCRCKPSSSSPGMGTCVPSGAATRALPLRRPLKTRSTARPTHVLSAAAGRRRGRGRQRGGQAVGGPDDARARSGGGGGGSKSQQAQRSAARQAQQEHQAQQAQNTLTVVVQVGVCPSL